MGDSGCLHAAEHLDNQGDDAYSDGEYEVEQSNGLEPTVIFKILAPSSSIKKLAPEQTITLFALRLAFIEKLASGIGTLSFIWATTIILGGFASSINPVDFMVITVILATEGTRLFSRSGEMEWQHLASKSSHSLVPQSVGTLKLDRAKSHGDTKKESSSEVLALSSEPLRKQPESAIKPKYRRSLTPSWHDDPGSPIGRCREETFQPILCLQPNASSTHNSARKTTVRGETEGFKEEVSDNRLDHHTSWDNDDPDHNMTRLNSTTTGSSSAKFSKTFRARHGGFEKLQG